MNRFENIIATITYFIYWLFRWPLRIAKSIHTGWYNGREEYWYQNRRKEAGRE